MDIAQTIGATLALWPRLGHVGLRSAPPDRAVDPKRCEMRMHQPHRWIFERKAWRCTVCSRVAKRRTQHNRPPPGKCPNERNAEHHDRFQLEAQRQGHVTWGAFPWILSIFLVCAVRSACGMVHAQPGSEVQRSSSLRQRRVVSQPSAQGAASQNGSVLGRESTS